MKKPLLSLVVSLTCLISISALPKVAVLDILPQAGIDPSVVVPVTETIMEEVVGARAYIVLDRAYIEQVLKEMEFELSGLTNDTQATKAGQFLGADYVVAGKVQTIGDAYFLVAKMIEVRSGVIVAQASSQGEGKLNALLDIAHTVGAKLIAGSPISPLEPLARTGTAAPSAAAETPSSPAATPGQARRIKAGFALSEGPEERDYCVNIGLDRLMKSDSGWIDIVVEWKVRKETAGAAIEKLAGVEKCEIVISDLSGIDSDMERAALMYPATKFESFFGTWKESNPKNLGIFGYDEIAHKYIEGLVAGSLSASAKVGLLSENVDIDRPWIRQMLNAYSLGVLAANPKASVLVSFLPENPWNDQDGWRAAALSLADRGCDFILGVLHRGIIQALEPRAQSGARVRAFLRGGPYTISPSVIVSGPLENWYYLFREPIAALRDGAWKADPWYPPQSYVFGGGGESFNPAFLGELSSKKIKTQDLGSLSLLELAAKREAQLASHQFDVWAGPIKDQNGKLRIAAGVHPDGRTLEAIDWYVENVTIVKPERRIKAGFLYPWPDEDDRGAAINQALVRLENENSSWLDIAMVRDPETTSYPVALDKLVNEEKCDIVFSCNWSYREGIEDAARENPGTYFANGFCAWSTSAPPNYAVFGFNLYAQEYLEGLVAGSLSSSGKIGVLTESIKDDPGCRIDVNAFALGALAANPKVQVLVSILPPDRGAHQDDDVAAAKALVDKGCDFLLGQTYPQLITRLEPLAKSGKKVRTFLDHRPYSFSPSIVVSGPLQNWSVFFENYIMAVKNGTWKSEPWYPPESYVFGGGTGEAFNPAFLPDLKSKKVKTPDLGTLPLLELVAKREAQIAAGEFEPFTGPIKDQKGTVRIKAGVRADWPTIDGIDWYVENVKIVQGE